ncbi:MAG: hypothetical protein ABI361_08215 [Nitrososphaera sp.]|jgi:hypothetical protein
MPDSPDDLEYKLQGRTLEVYLYLVRKKHPVGIRELQREIGLSSPSVAEYHVEKLVAMDIAQKDAFGRTRITRKVKVKALSDYVELGSHILPRLVLYAAAFTAVSIAIVVASWKSVNIYGLAVSFAAACIFWLEALKNRKTFLHSSAKSKGIQATETSPLQKSHFWVSLAPGVIALAAFAGTIAFLYYYITPAPPDTHTVQMPPVLGYGDDPSAPPPLSSSSPSVEYSKEMSAKKVQEAGPADRLIPSPAPELYAVLAFASALVIGFIAYLIVRYRCGELERVAVLPQEHMKIFAFGDQDYPARRQKRI